MKKLTTAFGAPVDDNQNIATAGERGPALLQNVWFLEKMAHFDREVIPERRMHAKGAGAHGTFTVTHDITKYTKAKIFSEIGKKTQMFARFSTVAGERGAADAERDIRGVAFKFYTDEGNWDLVGNNTPVFFLRDPLKFPDLNHAIKRDPRTGMRSADSNWDFWSNLPEALHQVTIVMSDRGIPKSFRHMHGFGSHTYSFINSENKRFWVKFTFKTQQGIQNLTDAEAGEIIARDRESNQRDLYESIERGEFPRWKLYVQIMNEEDANTYHIHPFDLPKAARGLPIDRSRGDGTESERRKLLRGRRAGCVLASEHRSRYQLLAGQDAAGSSLLLWRHAALSARGQLSADPGQRAEVPIPQLPPRRGHASRWQQRGSYQL